MMAEVEQIEEIESGNREELVLSFNLSRQFKKIVEFVPALSNELLGTSLSIERHAGKLADLSVVQSKLSNTTWLYCLGLAWTPAGGEIMFVEL